MSAAEATRNELAWLDGRSIPRGEFSLPVGDAGFVLGATVTEQLRTFQGRLFLPDDHGRRFVESLNVVGIDSPWPIPDLLAAAADVAAHNHKLKAAGDDLGLVIFATPGDLAAQHHGRAGRPRVAIHTFPLAFGLWADAFERGVAIRTVSVTQVPESCWPLKAKVRSRLHYHLADREAHAAEPGARAILAHADGRISETSTANVAIVKDDIVTTPPATDALGGVSLACAMRLARALDIGWNERSLTAADLATADEILLTSTPSCILPATSFNGRSVGTGRPGPAFHAILDAWSKLVGLDIADQARRHRQRLTP
jgi:branched-subunit amino acid aminotransferase/4-amino-4-deoxychorismate lyase